MEAGGFPASRKVGMQWRKPIANDSEGLTGNYQVLGRLQECLAFNVVPH